MIDVHQAAHQSDSGKMAVMLFLYSKRTTIEASSALP